jgi:ferritin
MNEELHHRLNEHLQLELGAAHNYLAMSLWFEVQNLPGFAGWLRAQSSEETGHAHRFINHLLERDSKIELPAIPKPPSEWASPRAAIEATLASEQRVTESINSLYDLAEKVGDRAARNLLQWFVDEQVEEESTVRNILGRLELAGDEGLGLLLVDQEVGKSAPSPPSGGATG